MKFFGILALASSIAPSVLAVVHTPVKIQTGLYAGYTAINPSNSSLPFPKVKPMAAASPDITGNIVGYLEVLVNGQPLGYIAQGLDVFGEYIIDVKSNALKVGFLQSPVGSVLNIPTGLSTGPAETYPYLGLVSADFNTGDVDSLPEGSANFAFLASTQATVPYLPSQSVKSTYNDDLGVNVNAQSFIFTLDKNLNVQFNWVDSLSCKRCFGVEPIFAVCQGQPVLIGDLPAFSTEYGPTDPAQLRFVQA